MPIAIYIHTYVESRQHITMAMALRIWLFALFFGNVSTAATALPSPDVLAALGTCRFYCCCRLCVCVAALLNAYLCVGALLMKRRKNVCCKNCGNFFGFLQPRLIMVLLPFCCCGYYIFFSLACIVFATRTLHWPWHSFCIICGNE